MLLFGSVSKPIQISNDYSQVKLAEIANFCKVSKTDGQIILRKIGKYIFEHCSGKRGFNESLWYIAQSKSLNNFGSIKFIFSRILQNLEAEWFFAMHKNDQYQKEFYPGQPALTAQAHPYAILMPKNILTLREPNKPIACLRQKFDSNTCTIEAAFLHNVSLKWTM